MFGFWMENKIISKSSETISVHFCKYKNPRVNVFVQKPKKNRIQPDTVKIYNKLEKRRSIISRCLQKVKTNEFFYQSNISTFTISHLWIFQRFFPCHLNNFLKLLFRQVKNIIKKLIDTSSIHIIRLGLAWLESTLVVT